MDRVVLCEGKRDVKLVEKFYERERSGVEVGTFLGEEVAHSELKNRESATFRNFLERRNPNDVLAKSENGVTNLERLFAKLARHFLKQRSVQVCVLIDLDKKNYDHLNHASEMDKYRELLNDLDERVRGNYSGSNLRVERDGVHRRSSAQIAGEAILHSERDEIGSFDVLAFRSDLEDAAEILDGDSAEIEDGKLREFLGGTGADPMRDVL
jgi:5S rRNA maturation endonuclease (ribonuclease M5)